MNLKPVHIIIMLVALLLLVALLVLGVAYFSRGSCTTDNGGTPVTAAPDAQATPAPLSSQNPITGEDVPVVPDQPVDNGAATCEEQVKKLMDALCANDAATVVAASHPNYWTKEGVTLEEAAENTRALLEEDMAWSNVSYTSEAPVEADAADTAAKQNYVATYAPAGAVLGAVMRVNVTLNYTLDGEAVTRPIVLFLIQIDGSWFVVSDVGQLLY